jgi:hypothetical protein
MILVCFVDFLMAPRLIVVALELFSFLASIRLMLGFTLRFLRSC